MRILITEDEEFFGNVLLSVLTKAGYDVQLAENGLVARSLLSTKAFNLLITDARMPEMDGIELIQWCNEKRPSLPIILMSGFADLLEGLDPKELGVRELMTKPFQQKDLLEAIERAMASEPPQPKPAKTESAPPPKLEVTAAGADNSYCRLAIDEFVSGKTLPFAIYIRLSCSKYIKVAYNGEDVDIEQVKAYRQRGVTHLYMTREDFRRYLDQNLSLSKSLSKVKSIPKDRKLRFMKHTGEVLMEHVKAEGLNQERYADARNFVMAVMENVSEREDLVTLLEMLNAHSDSLYAHSLGVGLYAVMICQHLGWRANPTSYTAMLAGLFHDVGKKEIEPQVLALRRMELNQKQRSQIETHAMRGAEIMTSVPNIPEEIAQVTLQHHEDCMGHGYPRHLTKASISPLSRLVSVANVFCEYVVKNPDHPEGMPAKAAIQQIEQFKKESLDIMFLGALKEAALAQ